MSRPRRPPTRSVAFRLPKTLYDRLERVATARQTKVGSYLRAWVERAFEQKPQPKM